MLKQYYYYSSSSSSSLSMNAIMSSGSSATWEEKAFAEDAVGALGGGGCVWPPRSYSCSFCMREFRSAQALGGHMNVHRRDRARLKQCLHNTNPTPNLATNHHRFPNHIQNHHTHHASMANYPFSSPRALLSAYSSSNPSSIATVDPTGEENRSIQVGNYVETDLRVGLINTVVRGSRQLAKGYYGEEEASSFKRAKIGCADEFNSMEDLDLELRLGEPTTPKVKRL